MASRATDGDVLFLHRLEQGRLRLGRRPVDLVGQDEVGEDRSGLEAEIAVARIRLVDDRGADDVRRHEVGRELDARELESSGGSQGLHELGLADSRHPLEQHVAAGQQAGEHAVDDALLSHDHAADLLLDRCDAVPGLN